MSQTGETEQASRAAGRAAGYCWEPYLGGKARCTRPPHEDRKHVDHFTGRTSIADVKGVEWTN